MYVGIVNYSFQKTFKCNKIINSYPIDLPLSYPLFRSNEICRLFKLAKKHIFENSNNLL